MCRSLTVLRCAIAAPRMPFCYVIIFVCIFLLNAIHCWLSISSRCAGIVPRAPVCANTHRLARHNAKQCAATCSAFVVRAMSMHWRRRRRKKIIAKCSVMLSHAMRFQFGICVNMKIVNWKCLRRLVPFDRQDNRRTAPHWAHKVHHEMRWVECEIAAMAENERRTYGILRR